MSSRKIEIIIADPDGIGYSYGLSGNKDDDTVTTRSTVSTLTPCFSSHTVLERSAGTSNPDPDRPSLLWKWRDLEQAVVDKRTGGQHRALKKSPSMQERIRMFDK